MTYVEMNVPPPYFQVGLKGSPRTKRLSRERKQTESLMNNISRWSGQWRRTVLTDLCNLNDSLQYIFRRKKVKSYIRRIYWHIWISKYTYICNACIWVVLFCGGGNFLKDDKNAFVVDFFFIWDLIIKNKKIKI